MLFYNGFNSTYYLETAFQEKLTTDLLTRAECRYSSRSQPHISSTWFRTWLIREKLSPTFWSMSTSFGLTQKNSIICSRLCFRPGQSQIIRRCRWRFPESSVTEVAIRCWRRWVSLGRTEKIRRFSQILSGLEWASRLTFHMQSASRRLWWEAKSTHTTYHLLSAKSACHAHYLI